MQRKKYYIPKDEHTRYYGRQGDRNPQFIIYSWEIEVEINDTSKN